MPKLYGHTPKPGLEEQKEHLKTNRAMSALETLMPLILSHAPDVMSRHLCVGRGHRYMRNRLDQVDYQGALENGLPIGSGEIDSAHRFVVQTRLKRPGA